MSTLTVAVIVPTVGRPDDLLRCLDGMAHQSRLPEQVIVVTQAIDEPTHAALETYVGKLSIMVVKVDGPGLVRARNAGWRTATEDVVAFTDDDAVPREDWLSRICAHFESDAAIGAVGGRDWVRHDGVLVDGEARTVGRVLWFGRFVGFHHLGIGPARDVDFLKGANMSFRRQALPGFDTNLRGRGAEHYDDWSACLHVRRRGWRVVYDPDIAVDHFEASRGALDPRFAIDLRMVADRAHNQTYAAVRYLPPRRALTHLAFVFLIGTTAAPGLGLTLWRVIRNRDRRQALPMLATSWRARWEGVTHALRLEHAGSAGDSGAASRENQPPGTEILEPRR